ncbi:unnamed protein product, partial [Meganyctiphanes norvegica]
SPLWFALCVASFSISPSDCARVGIGGAHDAVTYTNGIRNNQNVCLTKGCAKAATAMLEMMDATVDPCSDFARFACGGFHDKTIIPDDKSRVNQFSVTADDLEQNIRKLLNEDITDDDSEATRMVKTYYNTCMDT